MTIDELFQKSKVKGQRSKPAFSLQFFTIKAKKHSTKSIFRASNVVKSESLIPKKIKEVQNVI